MILDVHISRIAGLDRRTVALVCNGKMKLAETEHPMFDAAQWLTDEGVAKPDDEISLYFGRQEYGPAVVSRLLERRVSARL